MLKGGKTKFTEHVEDSYNYLHASTRVNLWEKFQFLSNSLIWAVQEVPEYPICDFTLLNIDCLIRKTSVTRNRNTFSNEHKSNNIL